MKRKYRILVVGAGWIGRTHVEALQQTGRVDLSVCDIREEVAEQLAADFSLKQAFDSLDAALEHRWNAAVIATTAPSHVQIGTRLSALRVPLLVEKPLAINTQGVEGWAEVLKRTKAPLMVGYIFRCHPVLIAIREAILAGSIGQPIQLTARRGGNLPIRRPAYASMYCADREQGGGVIHDILSHVYNAGEWLIGPMDRVKADTDHLYLPDAKIEDSVNAIARHGAVLANYTVNQHQAIAEFMLDVHGASGTLRADFINCWWAVANTPDGEWETHQMPVLTRSEWFAKQAEIFLEVIAGQRPPPCSFEDAVTTLHAINATFEATSRPDVWTIPKLS